MTNTWDRLKDAVDVVVEGVGNNLAPTISLLGVLLAFLGASRLHWQRLRRERNARIRALLGEYVGAVNHRQDAKTFLAARVGSLSSGVPVFHALREVAGKGADPAVVVLRSNVLQAREELTRAESAVDSLFFQLSINREKGSEDLVFAMKLLSAAEAEPDYTRAYNFMLSVAVRWFGNSLRDRLKERTALKRLRPDALSHWERYAKQFEVDDAIEEDRIAAMLAGEEDSANMEAEEERQSSSGLNNHQEQTKSPISDSGSSDPDGVVNNSEP